jgi:hypothetical protein
LLLPSFWYSTLSKKDWKRHQHAELPASVCLKRRNPHDDQRQRYAFCIGSKNRDDHSRSPPSPPSRKARRRNQAGDVVLTMTSSEVESQLDELKSDLTSTRSSLAVAKQLLTNLKVDEYQSRHR